MGTLLHRVGEALSRKMAPFLLNCANSGELARCCLALGQYAVIGLAASAAICVEASADETETPAVGLAIRGFAEMSREAVGYLTQVIEPANYVVPPEGSTIDQLIQARCGDGTPAASQEILKKRLVELNAEVLQSHPLETPVSGGTKLNFPFCAPVYKNTTVPYYNNKAGLEGVIRSHYPVWGPVTQAKAIEQTEKCQDKSLEKCSRQLDDGDAILLPYSSPWVEGRIKSGLSPSEVAKKLESFTPEYKANTEENLTTTDAPLEYVGPLKASDLSPKDSCNTAPSADWPFDEALVRERLQKSEALAKTTNAPLRQAHIAIVDSGLGLDALKAIFTDKVLYLNKQEKENGVDDDQDQIADDLHGAGIQSDLSTSGDFYALSDADLEQFNHGTQVASLVLGGPKFLQEITASSEDSPLSISMLRASWRASPGVVHPAPPFLPVALTWVRSHGGGGLESEPEAHRTTVDLLLDALRSDADYRRRRKQRGRSSGCNRLPRPLRRHVAGTGDQRRRPRPQRPNTVQIQLQQDSRGSPRAGVRHPYDQRCRRASRRKRYIICGATCELHCRLAEASGNRRAIGDQKSHHISNRFRPVAE